MQDESIAAFLDGLASAAPAPGGGAVAALQAAVAAALVEMVNLIDEARARRSEQLMQRALARAGARSVSTRQLETAGEDA